MTNIIDNFTISYAAVQSGLPKYDFHPEIIVGALIMDRDTTFAGADVASVAALITKIQTGIIASGSTRIIPVWQFEAATNNTAKPVDATFGYGGVTFIRDSKVDMTFEMWKGGYLLYQQLRKLNNAVGKVIVFIDNAGNIIGTSTDGGLSMSGFALETLNFQAYKFKDGSKADSFDLHVSLAAPAEFNDSMHVIPTATNLQSVLKGLLAVRLSEVLANTATSIFHIGAKTTDGDTDLADFFDTELEDKTLWSITKAGVDCPIASSVYDGTNKCWTLTLTTPLTVADVVVINLASASALATGDVGGPPDNGFESIPLSVVLN